MTHRHGSEGTAWGGTLWRLPHPLLGAVGLLGALPLPHTAPRAAVVTRGAQTPSPAKAGRGRTHSRKSEEGDADEGEGCRQEPPVPGLGVLVPVANGCQGDLRTAGPVAQPGRTVAAWRPATRARPPS